MHIITTLILLQNFTKKSLQPEKFEQRLETIKNVREAGISVCSGGIIGMGETWHDRARMLEVLANLTPQPESVPINALVAGRGYTSTNQKTIKPIELVRMIATARIILPKSRIRLSAGRKNYLMKTQILCLLSGANSIFYGESLLTTENNDMSEDKKLISSFKEIDEKINKDIYIQVIKKLLNNFSLVTYLVKKH